MTDGSRPPDLVASGSRSRATAYAAAGVSLALALVFLGLCVWQIERRAWKLDLIARVEARLAAAPVAAPGRDAWPRLTREADEYRRVTLTGRYLADKAARVMAVTEKGAGSWLLTPLVTVAGDTVLVNRGFVPADAPFVPAGESGTVTLTGLLRFSEPGGGFLRANDPKADRWYSRDVEAIAAARGLGTVAPFFVDRDAAGPNETPPIGGLTVVSFRNTHLVYALTWLALAGLACFAAWRFCREARPTRSDGGEADVQVGRTEDDSARQNLLLLVQLRWIAVAGQVVTIAGATLVLGISLPLQAMGAVLAGLCALNLASLAWLARGGRVTEGWLVVALLLDVAALTLQLYLSGGVTNPFTSLFLLQLTLAAVLLNRWGTATIVVLCCSALVGLSFAYHPLILPEPGAIQLFDLYRLGMLVGFALDAALIGYFVSRISRNLRERDARLADLRQRAVEEDHIVRMGLLASGAAHELGTPLSSLSVILGDWRRMPELTRSPEITREIEEMQREVGRCKAIVTGILLAAGAPRGEASHPTTVRGFVTELVAEWRRMRGGAQSLKLRDAFGPDQPIVSDAALKQVVYNVLDNAYEISPEALEIVVERSEDSLQISVADEGPGFSAEMLSGLGQPYTSSKGRLGGGLGLFLVVNVVRKLGGTVAARNRPEGGAVVTIRLPLAALAV